MLSGGGHAVMADGTVHHLADHMTASDIHALATINGGETIRLDAAN